MTTTTRQTTLLSPADLDRAAARRALPIVAVVATAIPVALSWFDRDSLPEALTEIGLEVVAGALLFGLVVRLGLRRPSAGVRGIVMGAIGLLLVVPAFWSGLPMILGAAAALLGVAGKRAERGSGTAIAALVLGLLAVVAYIAIYVVDAVSHGGFHPGTD